MAVFFLVFDVNEPNPEPFAVMRADTNERSGDGVEGTVMSLHLTRAEAETAAKELEAAESDLREPRFLTAWEREDYRREKRGEKPVGPPQAKAR